MNHLGVSPWCTTPPLSQRPITATTHTHQGIPPNRTLIPNPPRSSGVTIVGPTTAIATHTQPRRTIVPNTVATSLTPAMHQGPTSRRCGHARRRSTPTPRRCTNNTQSQGHRAVCPFGDPHVHKVTPSGETKQGCSHSNANTLGPIHHMARTRKTDDKSKGRKKEGVHQQRVLC